MTIYKYPLKFPMEEQYRNRQLGLAEGATKHVDYLMLRRERFKYDGKNVPNFYNREVPGNQATVKQHPDRCYIAIPAGISTSYGPAYRRQDIGVSGVAAMNMMQSGNDFTQMAKDLQDAAFAALPEFSTNAVLSLINGFNQFVGLQGSMDINAIQALQKGQVFNPYSEQIFQGMSFRTHNFAFKFMARSRNESRHIQNIIDYIKIGTLPRVRGGEFDKRFINAGDKYKVPGGEVKRAGKGKKEGTSQDIWGKEYFKHFNKADYAKSNRFFDIPDRFKLRFVRFGANDDGTMGSMTETTRRDLMFKMYRSVCTGINVNYTPDNQYVSFKQPDPNGVSVPAIVMTLSFTETRLLTENDAAVGY